MSDKTLRILLVEDDEHDAVAFKRAFRKSDVLADVTICQRAEDALARLRTDAASFDVAVIDHKLPGMSGMDLCMALLAEKVPLPLVILTGNGSEGLAVEALKVGVDDYIIKKPDKSYLDLVPLVLSDVVRKHEDRRARKEAEKSLRATHKSLLEKTAELEQINADLSEYSSAVSHDLRAPLRAIHNYADFLHDDLAATLRGEQKQYLDGLRQAVRQAEALVADLLEFCRAGEQPAETEIVNVRELLGGLVGALNLSPNVEIRMAEQWPGIEASPALLKRVFQNLIDNAIKFNDSPHKLIELGWQALPDERQEFFVRDNGIGIDPRYHQQIFGVFQRLHPQGEIEGTGIGLAIVKKMLTKLGGTIRLESKPGQGSTFFVALPASRQEDTGHEGKAFPGTLGR